MLVTERTDDDDVSAALLPRVLVSCCAEGSAEGSFESHGSGTGLGCFDSHGWRHLVSCCGEASAEGSIESHGSGTGVGCFDSHGSGIVPFELRAPTRRLGGGPAGGGG